MGRHTLIVFSISISFLGISVAGVKVPWQKRKAANVDVPHKLAREKLTPEMWPEEPESPDDVDPTRFGAAFEKLCGPMPDRRLEVYSESLLKWSAEFEVDPFLLAALVYDRSGCRPRTPDREVTHGVTRIDVKMHAPHIRGGEYRYFLKDGAKWRPEVLELGEFPFNKWKAEKIRSNLYFASAILRVFANQCASLDSTFKHSPHRHFVSHWFYGDRVRSAGPEDRVLTARRRFLEYYRDKVRQEVGTFHGKSLHSPLDGAPRLVLDYFGNPRGKKGGYGHRGIDLDGTTGEPVRAIGNGRVTFAGVDLKGAGSRQLTLEQSEALTNRSMGPGGLYVHVNHFDGIGSIYMHLATLGVENGDEVRTGEIIGTLGRSGTVQSGPHLHFEIRVGTERVDPAEILSSGLVNPFSYGREGAVTDVSTSIDK